MAEIQEAPSPISEIEKSLAEVSQKRAKSQAKNNDTQKVENNNQAAEVLLKAEADAKASEAVVKAEEVEPTVENTEGKPEEKKEAKKGKTKFWKPEEKVAESKPEAPKAGVETKGELPKEIQDKLAAYERILSKPSIKAVLKAEESGKDFLTHYNEMAARDPFKMSYEELYKMQLDEDGYTESEKARKLENFIVKDEDDQADIISKFRKDLKAKWNQELTDYTPKFESQEKEVDRFENFDKEFTPVAKSFENRELYGVVVTPEIVKNILDSSRPLIKMDAQGNLDKEDYFRVKFIVENLPLIAQTIEDEVTREITDKYEGLITQSLPSTNGTSVPQSRQQATDTQKRIVNLKASLPQSK